MSGILTNGLDGLTLPFTGKELFPADTQSTAGAQPESVSVSYNQFFANSVALGTADTTGTTATLTSAMICANNAQKVIFVSSGSSTASTLTLPTVANLLDAYPHLYAVDADGDGVAFPYVLRFVNSNSQTATIATNTGWTSSGTLTAATTTWREFLVKFSSATAATITSIGTGTNS